MWCWGTGDRQGVPIRLELGPKDMAAGACLLARRDGGPKEVVAWADLPIRVPALLEQIHVRRPPISDNCFESIKAGWLAGWLYLNCVNQI